MSGPVGFPHAGFRGDRISFIDFLNASALGDNLQLLIDPGDINCVADAADQTLLDLSNSPDPILGFSTGVGADDPVFIGTVGRRFDERYSFDGVGTGDTIFWLTRPLVAQNVHVTGSNTTIALTFTATDFSDEQVLLATTAVTPPSNASSASFNLGVRQTTGKVKFQLGTGAANIFDSTAVVSSGVPYALVISSDNGGGANSSFMNLNGVVETFALNYVQASNNTPSFLAGRGLAGGEHPLTGSIGIIAMWDRAVSQNEAAEIIHYLRRRYG